MLRMFMNYGIDMRKVPILVYPTLHYQNGGLEIGGDGFTRAIGNLLVAGEAVGGIHGRNRLMGNSLLDVIVFGRDAGKAAAARAKEVSLGQYDAGSCACLCGRAESRRHGEYRRFTAASAPLCTSRENIRCEVTLALTGAGKQSASVSRVNSHLIYSLRLDCRGAQEKYVMQMQDAHLAARMLGILEM